MPKPTYMLAGILAGIIALLLPAGAVVSFHPGASAELAERLLRGGLYLKAALATLAGYLVLLGLLAGRADEPAPPASAATSSRTEGAATSRALFVLLLVAAGLRLHALDAGLWYDEIITYLYYGGLGLGEALTTYNSQNQHLLYTLAWKPLLPLFADPALALRLPAVVFGVASVGALYAFAAETVGRREALAATALMALSYHHVWFSQNARGYTALLLFTLLSSVALVRALRSGRPGDWALYALAVALGAYAQPTMVLICAGQALSLLVRSFAPGGPRRALVGLAFGFVPAALLVVTLYAPVLPQFSAVSASAGKGVARWSNPLWGLLEFLRGMQVGGAGVVVLAAGGLVFAAGCARLFAGARVVLELFFFPVALTLAVVVATGHHVWPRLLLFAMGHALMIAVAGCFAVGSRAADRLGGRAGLGGGLGWAGVVTGCLVFALALPRAYGPKQDFAAAAAFVREQARPEDAVAVAGLAEKPLLDYYRAGWTAVHSAAELERLRAGSRRTWLIYTFPFELKTRFPDIMEALGREFATVARFDGTLGGGAVYVARSQG